MRFAVLLIALPLAAAACGGSSKSAHTTTSTSTASGSQPQSSFVQQGNQVCIRSDRRIYRLGRLTRDPTGWAKTAAAGRIGLAEMRRVRPSAKSAHAFELMMQYGRQLVGAIEDVHDNLVKKQYDAAISAQFRAARLQDKVHAQARRAGLTFCQQNLTSWPL